MKLKEALATINYDSSWAIYAEYPLTEDTPCRFGQTQFENGGLLDDKTFVINGESAHDRVQDMIDVSVGEEDYQREIAIETLIFELNDEFEDMDNEVLCPDDEADRRAMNETYSVWDAAAGKQLTGSAAANYPTAQVRNG